LRVKAIDLETAISGWWEKIGVQQGDEVLGGVGRRL
jgi:hypothetical protein